MVHIFVSRYSDALQARLKVQSLYDSQLQGVESIIIIDRH